MTNLFLSLSLVFLLVGTTVGGALAQPTPPEPRSTVDDHVAWVLSLFDGGAAELTEAEVETRFDSNFLRLVPPGEFIATTRQLAESFGALELIEDRSTDPGEFVGIFRAASGDALMISFAVNRRTGRMAGFFITPAAGPEPIASPPAGVGTPPATPLGQRFRPRNPAGSHVVIQSVREDRAHPGTVRVDADRCRGAARCCSYGGGSSLLRSIP